MSDKTIAIRVDEKFFKQIKLRLAENGMTLKNYIISLIQNDLKENSNILQEEEKDILSPFAELDEKHQEILADLIDYFKHYGEEKK